jgi:Transglutaminase-like superfamily
LISKIKALSLLPQVRRLLLAEALCFLLWSWFVVRCIGFKRYARFLGEVKPGEYIAERSPEEVQLALVRWAIRTVNRQFGMRFNCLMQGISAKLMLNRRGIANTLVLGAKFSKTAEDVRPDEFEAHAWLWAGKHIIVGGEERPSYVPLTSYDSAPTREKKTEARGVS